SSRARRWRCFQVAGLAFGSASSTLTAGSSAPSFAGRCLGRRIQSDEGDRQGLSLRASHHKPAVAQVAAAFDALFEHVDVCLDPRRDPTSSANKGTSGVVMTATQIAISHFLCEGEHVTVLVSDTELFLAVFHDFQGPDDFDLLLDPVVKLLDAVHVEV